MRRHVIMGSLLVAAMGCALPNEGSEESGEGNVANVSQPVAKEISGKVEYAFRYYGNANLARAQFATPNFGGGCSSTMIGPNILLTAAHCGPKEADANQVAQITFMTYRSSETQQNTESFNCKRLIHGWPRHDLALHYCDANGAGVNPGDKYGYLDFETRAPVVGDQVYSIWWNSVDGGATGGEFVPLYSAGKVTSTNFTFWGGTITSGPAAGTGPAGHPVGIEMDTWGQPGTSGSSNIDANTNRILVGPTTLARQDTSWKAAWSMNTYFNADLLAPGTYPGANFIANVEASNFPTGTYDFNSYVGRVDKDGDAIFDVQADIEAQHGENARSTYYLGFGNRRRNALWDAPWAILDYAAKTMSIEVYGAVAITRHRLLHLKPNTNYRVGVRVNTTSAGSGAALAVDFEHAFNPPVSIGNLTTTPGTTAMRSVVIRTDAQGDDQLGIRTTSAFKGSISDIEVIEDGTTTTFELADQREGWTTVFGQPGNFLPHGLTSETATAPDFALAVTPIWDAAIPVSTQSQLFPARYNRLCFSARTLGPTTESGVVQVKNGTTMLLNATFPLTQTWTQHCHVGIAPSAASETTLTFSGSGTFDTTYLVDNLKVDQDPTIIVWWPPGGPILAR